MTKKLPLELKQTRKPIQTACGFCHEKHLQCDVGRPCQNCIKRNIGYLCRDKVRKPRKRSSTATSGIDASKVIKKESIALTKVEGNGSVDQNMATVSAEESSTPPAQGSMRTKNDERILAEPLSRIHSFSNLLTNNSNSFLHDPLIPSILTGNADIKSDVQQGSNIDRINDQIDFDSMWAGNEYMKLNDIAGLLPVDDGTAGNNEGAMVPEQLPAMRRSSSSQLFQYLNVGPSIPRTDSRPYISLDMARSGSINRIDNGQGETSNPDSMGPSPQNLREVELSPYRLRQLIKTPKDLFEKQQLIKPHNYRSAYKDLLRCLHRMFLGSYVHSHSDTLIGPGDDEEQDQKRILRRNQLKHIARSIVDRYAPIFVTLTSNMIEDDLLLQEIILQRTLLEFENMAKLVNCTPICIWRRSGEICFVSNEFLSLTGFTKKEMLNKRRFIPEFLDHQSVVDYYDLFHEYLAFGSKDGGKSTTSDGQATFGECNLLVHSGSFLKCACCWTVKRDSFNISLLVMGQFLPIFDVE